MLIMPAIDLRAGRCVRLAQGRFDAVTEYGAPETQLRAFAEAGAEWVHVVDLDGAEAGEARQYALIGALARKGLVNIQSGGGVRTQTHIETLLNAGVQRVVIGSAAVRNPDAVRNWTAIFGLERICCAFDVRQGAEGYEVALSGWTEGAGVSLEQALALYPRGSLRHILVTDISRDGVMTGPNVPLMQALCAARPDLAVQASGGVASLEDLSALRATGARAAIVGRALYEKRFTLEAALAG
ncbi:MAG TPA: 1-(5-phosphoribosyl)-5-[(5-phosphoribosylamino)methylideneamino]imidazole-4-carboxamide isomerase [Terricaulis sp.]|nr:1-(5-phosphoribosyl)-5-[(5-phosphoribosylamino)methylideneamino]imidazole-4-carboxamide isomerase [Terricaulis sp.]